MFNSFCILKFSFILNWFIGLIGLAVVLMVLVVVLVVLGVFFSTGSSKVCGVCVRSLEVSPKYAKMQIVVTFLICLETNRAKKLGSSALKSGSGRYRKVEETQEKISAKF